MSFVKQFFFLVATSVGAQGEVVPVRDAAAENSYLRGPVLGTAAATNAPTRSTYEGMPAADDVLAPASSTGEAMKFDGSREVWSEPMVVEAPKWETETVVYQPPEQEKETGGGNLSREERSDDSSDDNYDWYW